MFPNSAFDLLPPLAWRIAQRRQGILSRDSLNKTGRIIDHAKSAADQSGRRFIYLASVHSHANGESKEEDMAARAIAERDGIKEGLVCIFSVIETCRSFCVVGNRAIHRKEVVSHARKCRHLYWFLCNLIDPVLGLDARSDSNLGAVLYLGLYK
uniref:Uncharacterized protein n=1 Tax=Candidatus Kentrum sp. MB TaxID=2138164 RepID=A0A451BBD8_9GAMM|nr:MAG: hypothetical protein BECKMB1821G_GA0114241_101411 [Candidatus Kentron sp. MB]VFK31690.1 MAG: hypothetical protein BECKMB1821I_GA0114274_102613 [Candidatus Kentron sp. MB]VFK75613.1 MAG: hypothetical protein BECKMB1821H_GA0114242_102712 [Candidatus Kentron sp. MB]